MNSFSCRKDIWNLLLTQLQVKIIHVGFCHSHTLWERKAILRISNQTCGWIAAARKSGFTASRATSTGLSSTYSYQVMLLVYFIFENNIYTIISRSQWSRRAEVDGFLSGRKNPEHKVPRLRFQAR